MEYLIFIILGYLSGSILWSKFISKYLFHVDIVALSEDHNPGATNAYKYGGLACGLLSLIMDVVKAFIPVYIAFNTLDHQNILFAFIMVAPLVGHAYPIFNHFNGGKCIASTFGALLGLMPTYKIAFVLAFIYIIFSIICKINPHRARIIICYLVFTLYNYFKIKVASITLGTFLCTLVLWKKQNKRDPNIKFSITWFRLKKVPNILKG